MKLCISSTSNDKSALVDKRFGRCSYFAIYDTNTNAFSFIKNSAVNEAQGAGLSASQNIIDEKVDVVITGNVGPNAMKILNAADVTIYQFIGNTVEQQVQFFLENKLSTIDNPGPSHAGLGNRHKRR